MRQDQTVIRLIVKCLGYPGIGSRSNFGGKPLGQGIMSICSNQSLISLCLSSWQVSFQKYGLSMLSSD